MFYLFFRRMLQVYLSSCCICFTHMFANVLSGCCTYFYNGFQVFLQVFQVHVLSVSFAFICMLQVLHINVSKVGRVLHFPPCIMLPRLSVSSSSRRQLGIRRLLSLFSMLVTFGEARAPCERTKRHEKMTAGACVRKPKWQ
jgi:hypothetical protein